MGVLDDRVVRFTKLIGEGQGQEAIDDVIDQYGGLNSLLAPTI